MAVRKLKTDSDISPAVYEYIKRTPATPFGVSDYLIQRGKIIILFYLRKSSIPLGCNGYQKN